MDITLNTMVFTEDEQDLEADGGVPVIISSISAPEAFDSFLRLDSGKELKLYRPLPNNISLSWDMKLLLTRAKFAQINSLILEQVNLVKTYRRNQSTDILKGFPFKYDYINTHVWLNNFSNSGVFYSTESNKELIRCKIGVIEST